jgi:hypothetical protein
MDSALDTVALIFAVVVYGLIGLLLIASLVYFVLVVVQMFKREQTGLAIVCLATFFLCGGLGELIAFVMGWVKASEWGIKRIMVQWTGVTVATMLLFCCGLGGVQILGKNANSAFGTVGASIGVPVRR